MQWEHSRQLINGSCLTIVGDWPYSRDATPIHFHQTAALLEDCHFKLSQFFALVFLLNYLNLHICINTVYIIHTLVKHPFWASFLNYSNYLKHIYILQDRIWKKFLLLETNWNTFTSCRDHSCGQFLRPLVQSFCHLECSTIRTTGSSLLSYLSDLPHSVYSSSSSSRPEWRVWWLEQQ